MLIKVLLLLFSKQHKASESCAGHCVQIHELSMLIKVFLFIFSKQHKARTIKDIESCAGNPRESYSVKYCPLLPID